MRTFLLKTMIAAVVVVALHLVAALHADGWTDAFYLRFTGLPQRSLIVGTSRAAQGLKPDVLEDLLGPSAFTGHPFNFAFTVDHSPYGEAYLHAIKAKLDPDSRNGSFIVAVDPWSLSQEKGSSRMRETDFPLAGQHTFTGTPNFEYLLRNHPAGWGSLIGGPLYAMDTTRFLHSDGWLEIRIPMDSTTVRKRLQRKVKDYIDKARNENTPSTERLQFLDRTLNLLQEHGRVVMVRIPICDELADLEEVYWPGFSAQMEVVARSHGLPYLDFMPERGRFTYTDGNHLDSVSARAFSMLVASRLRAWPLP